MADIVHVVYSKTKIQNVCVGNLENRLKENVIAVYI